MKKNIVYSLLVSMFILSCAVPQKVNKWLPSSSKTFFLQGVEYQATVKDSVYAICGVAEIEHGQIFLDLEITNKKAQPILFNPKGIFYEFKFKNNIESISAFDPEIEILRSKIRENELEASQKNSEAWGATLFVLGAATAIVSEVAAGTAKTEEGYSTAIAANAAGNLGLEVGNSLLQNSMYHSMDKSFNANQRVYWKRKAFRKSHINANESMRGTIILPIYHINSLIKLTIPIDSTILEFNFDQKQFSRKDLIELERGH